MDILANFEDYKKQLDVAEMEAWKQQFYYIISVSQYDDYEGAVNYVHSFLRNEDINIQIAAMQGLDTLASRFMNMNKAVLPLLFDNLKSHNKSILYQTFDTLTSIAEFVIELRKEIYLSFFNNDIDFYTNKQLKKYIDMKELASLKTIEEKAEFILSFCHHSNDYNQAFNICLNFLKENKFTKLNVSAIQGLTYIIMRFETIDFNSLLPSFINFLNNEQEKYGSELIYAESLLADIAYYIPIFKLQAIKILKKLKSHYIKRYKLEEIKE